jgi:hypothetical protein
MLLIAALINFLLKKTSLVILKRMSTTYSSENESAHQWFLYGKTAVSSVCSSITMLLLVARKAFWIENRWYEHLSFSYREYEKDQLPTVSPRTFLGFLLFCACVTYCHQHGLLSLFGFLLGTGNLTDYRFWTDGKSQQRQWNGRCYIVNAWKLFNPAVPLTKSWELPVICDHTQMPHPAFSSNPLQACYPSIHLSNHPSIFKYQV